MCSHYTFVSDACPPPPPDKQFLQPENAIPVRSHYYIIICRNSSGQDIDALSRSFVHFSKQ